jgi:hypothetical protein
VQAHRWLDSAITDVVDVSRTKRPQSTGDQLSDSQNDPRWTIANLGLLLGQHATESDEGASTATVIMPVGALAGQPGQQPRLELLLAGEANVIPSGRIVGHEWLPQGALIGEVCSNLDEVDATSIFLGHGKILRRNEMIKRLRRNVAAMGSAIALSRLADSPS